MPAAGFSSDLGGSGGYDHSNSLGNNSYGSDSYSLGGSGGYDHSDSLGNGYGGQTTPGYSDPSSYSPNAGSPVSSPSSSGSSDHSPQGNSFGSAGVTDNGNGSSYGYPTGGIVSRPEPRPTATVTPSKVAIELSNPPSDFKLGDLMGSVSTGALSAGLGSPMTVEGAAEHALGLSPLPTNLGTIDGITHPDFGNESSSSGGIMSLAGVLDLPASTDGPLGYTVGQMVDGPRARPEVTVSYDDTSKLTLASLAPNASFSLDPGQGLDGVTMARPPLDSPVTGSFVPDEQSLGDALDLPNTGPLGFGGEMVTRPEPRPAPEQLVMNQVMASLQRPVDGPSTDAVDAGPLRPMARPGFMPDPATEIEAGDLLDRPLAPGELDNLEKMAVGDIDRAATRNLQLTQPSTEPYGNAYGLPEYRAELGAKGIDDAHANLVGVQILDAAVQAVVNSPSLAEQLRTERDDDIADTKRLVGEAVNAAEYAAGVADGRPSLNSDVVYAQYNADQAKAALEEHLNPSDPVKFGNIVVRALVGGEIPEDPRLDDLTPEQAHRLQAMERYAPGMASTMLSLQVTPYISGAIREYAPGLVANPFLKAGTDIFTGTMLSRGTTPPAMAVSDTVYYGLDVPIVDRAPGIFTLDNVPGDVVPGAASTAAAMGTGALIRAGIPAGAALLGVSVPPAAVTGAALVGGAAVSSETFTYVDTAIRNGFYDINDPADVKNTLDNMTPAQVREHNDRQDLLEQMEDHNAGKATANEGLLNRPGQAPISFNQDDGGPVMWDIEPAAPNGLDRNAIEDYLDDVDHEAQEPVMWDIKPHVIDEGSGLFGLF